MKLFPFFAYMLQLALKIRVNITSADLNSYKLLVFFTVTLPE